PAVGEDRSAPAHEGVQTAELADDVHAGALRQMIGVGQHDGCAELLELRGRDALDAAMRADRHERRRIDDPMSGPEAAEPCAARVGAQDGERRYAELCRYDAHEISMASP